MLTALSAVQAFQFGEDGKFARDSGLALQFIFGFLAGAYGACTTLSGEIRSGTALVVLSKPVGREVFFTAKLAGIGIFVALFSACAISASLLAERAAPQLYVTDRPALFLLLCSVPFALALAAMINRRWDRPIASVAFICILVCLITEVAITTMLHGRVSWDPCNHQNAATAHLIGHWRLVPAGLLVTMALVVLSATALALATRLATLPVMAICSAVLFGGLLSDYLLADAGSGVFAVILHTLLPNWQNFWMADALSGGGSIPWSYVAIAAVYSACYIAAVTVGGLLLFRNREMR
ncbi:MAG: hypothetical protein WCL44_12695 [bacterium]